MSEIYEKKNVLKFPTCLILFKFYNFLLAKKSTQRGQSARIVLALS